MLILSQSLKILYPLRLRTLFMRLLHILGCCLGRDHLFVYCLF